MAIRNLSEFDDDELFSQDTELVDDDDKFAVPDLTDLFEGRGGSMERIPDHHDPADLDIVRFPWKGDG